MWNSIIETAKYPHREMKQTIKLHTASSLCCFITFPACFGATWGRPTARKYLMIYLFVYFFFFFSLFISPRLHLFSDVPWFFIFLSFSSLCYIRVLTLFFPSLLFYVLFFISFLLSLYCSIISCFFLVSRLNFLTHIPVFNLPPELQKSGA